MRKVTLHQFKLDIDGSAIHVPTGMRVAFFDSFGHPIARRFRQFGPNGHLTAKAPEPDASGFVREEIEAMALRFARRRLAKRPTP